jgi:hypothetical protein
MTCTHISQARRKLNTLVRYLKDSSDTEVYEESGPYIKYGSVKAYVNDYVLCYSYGANYDTIYPSVISQKKVEERLNDIDDILNSCSCFADEKIRRESDNERRKELIEFHQEERRNLNAQIESIKSEYKENLDKQYALIETERKETSLVKKENSNLQRLLGLSESQAKQLEIRLTEKTDELKVSEKALNKLRQAFVELSISNATNSTEARVVKEQLD